MRLPATLACLLFAVVLIAGVWLGLSSVSMPVSDLGSAYTIGARTGLNSEHIHALWDGKVPDIHFRRREYQAANSYIWQRATISRPANCLDLVTDQATGRPTPPARLCQRRDSTARSEDRLYFEVTKDDAVRISVASKSPDDGRRAADGALFEVEGQIAIGPSFDQASKFEITLDAPGLDIPGPDLRPDPAILPVDDSHCVLPPLLQKMRSPLPLLLLPAVPARLCSFDASGGRKLRLMQFQSGWLQKADWSDRLGCRALLLALIPSPSPGDFAGCLGGPWNEFDRTDLSVSLFEVTASGDFAVIR